LRGRGQADVDAVVAQGMVDESRSVRIEPGEQAVVRLHERDLRADALEELCELASDRAAPEHEQPSRYLERLRRPDVRPVVAARESLERRDGRRRAGREDEPVVCELASVDLEAAGSR